VKTPLNFSPEEQENKNNVVKTAKNQQNRNDRIISPSRFFLLKVMKNSDRFINYLNNCDGWKF